MEVSDPSGVEKANCNAKFVLILAHAKGTDLESKVSVKLFCSC